MTSVIKETAKCEVLALKRTFTAKQYSAAAINWESLGCYEQSSCTLLGLFIEKWLNRNL